MKVTYFERLPRMGCNSIEILFREIRSALPELFEPIVFRCPTPAHTPFWLAVGLSRARMKAGLVNHIAGDIHYVALGLPCRRTIVTVHDLNRMDQIQGLRKLLLYWFYFKLPLRKARFVTAISDHTRDRLEQLLPELAGKTIVIPNCVSLSFVPCPQTFNKDLPRILQIGTAPNKNLERVIPALRGIPCVLHVVGKLTSRQRDLLLDSGIRCQNDVALSDSEILKAYRAADIVTFVSLAEGFGMPILEAQATGRAVLTSARPPMTEVAGNSVCAVNPEDAAEIRVGIKRLIDDDSYRQTMVMKGFENVLRFRPKEIARQYACLYQSILVEQGSQV